MNYGKKGVHKKQKALHSTSAKWGRKLVLTLFNVALIAIVASGILVASAGFGLFRGIIETAPEIGTSTYSLPVFPPSYMISTATRRPN